MSAHDADLTLKQMVEVCDKAIELRGSMSWEEFRSDWRKQMLGERLVEVLGEAVNPNSEVAPQRGRSAGFQPAVSPTSSRPGVRLGVRVKKSQASQVGNPRYSRLEARAT